jgi:hypothetical protein
LSETGAFRQRLAPFPGALSGPCRAVLVAEMGAIFGLSFGALPRLARAPWPLVVKLFVAWIFLLLLRFVLIAFVAIAFAEPPL